MRYIGIYDHPFQGEVWLRSEEHRNRRTALRKMARNVDQLLLLGESEARLLLANLEFLLAQPSRLTINSVNTQDCREHPEDLYRPSN